MSNTESIELDDSICEGCEWIEFCKHDGIDVNFMSDDKQMTFMDITCLIWN